ncbi:alpha/beta fold hydrolase [Cellulomonas algicola]|uniref:alpha/beta fold hydrolase n=1 Tax=Cellulomonas algicola TaxID=2071633 RepID=UPI001C3F9E49|nr:alpha/beta hydrolase [Cellulomonas algicola]
MGLPVVLVHGLRTSRTMWRAQVEALERAGRTALAVDLPGHGARVDEPFTFDGAVETVRAAVDDVGGRALVVGLSLGGYVGIAHAARHPEQVAGLVAASCSTRPLPLLVGGWALAARGIGRLPDHGEGLNAFMVRRFLPAQGALDVGAGGFALMVTRDVLREVTTATPLDDLARVDAPVWLVNGRFDHFRGDERAFLRACRHGRLVVVPGATHMVSLVAPERFTRSVLEALDDVDRADGASVAPGGDARRAGVDRAAPAR